VQHVVVKLVFLVPQSDAAAADIGHRLRDVEEMLEEFGRDVLIDVVVLGQREGDAHQIERVHRHPGRAVRLIDVAAGRQRRASVEDADIVESQESPLEDVTAFGVLAVDPPGEVQHQLVEDRLEKDAVEPWQITIVAGLGLGGRIRRNRRLLLPR
jgi:hypothetical protein